MNRDTKLIDEEVMARARRMYEEADVPHLMDFDDLPHFQWASWIRLAKHGVQ